MSGDINNIFNAIGTHMTNFGAELKNHARELVNGQCTSQFASWSSEKQLKTALKVALIAVAVAAVFTFLGGPITGLILGGVAAISAFAYYTNSKQNGIVAQGSDFLQHIKEGATNALKQAKTTIKNL